MKEIVERVKKERPYDVVRLGFFSEEMVFKTVFLTEEEAKAVDHQELWKKRGCTQYMELDLSVYMNPKGAIRIWKREILEKYKCMIEEEYWLMGYFRNEQIV